MGSVTIKTNLWDAFTGLSGQLKEIESHDFSPMWDRMREPIGQMFEEIFHAQVDSDGQSWPPHAPSTVARYGPHPLLILTSAMYGSLTGYGEGHYEIVEPLSFTWGTSLVYAATHQFGDDSRNIPRREFVFVGEEWRTRFMIIVKEYVVDTMFARFK